MRAEVRVTTGYEDDFSRKTYYAAVEVPLEEILDWQGSMEDLFRAKVATLTEMLIRENRKKGESP
jgi:hypothetical protein